MEPTEALQTLETSLRLLIREVLGESWRLSVSRDIATMERRQLLARNKRNGALVDDDLLEFAEFSHLKHIITENWQHFEEVFRDQTRTAVYLNTLEAVQVYLGAVEDVRNDIAHSRTLVSFERDLISGIAGMIRNQISLFRTNRDPATMYYPLIESVFDNTGVRGVSTGTYERPSSRRIAVGEAVEFECRAFDPKDRELEWTVHASPSHEPSALVILPHFHVATTGSTATVRWIPGPDDVGEATYVLVAVRAAGTKYHRTKAPMMWTEAIDDSRYFVYAVNPPAEG